MKGFVGLSSRAMVCEDLYRLMQFELKSAGIACLGPVIDSGYLCIKVIYELTHLNVLSCSCLLRRHIRGLQKPVI